MKLAVLAWSYHLINCLVSTDVITDLVVLHIDYYYYLRFIMTLQSGSTTSFSPVNPINGFQTKGFWIKPHLLSLYQTQCDWKRSSMITRLNPSLSLGIMLVERILEKHAVCQRTHTPLSHQML